MMVNYVCSTCFNEKSSPRECGFDDFPELHRMALPRNFGPRPRFPAFAGMTKWRTLLFQSSAVTVANKKPR